MVTCSAMSGSGRPSEIVAPFIAEENTISSAPTVAFARSIASRNEPGPVGKSLVTDRVANSCRFSKFSMRA